MKILAFAGSNSRHSINKKLVQYALKYIPQHVHTLIDLNDFEMPLYSIDRQKEQGLHQLAHDFLKLIETHDAIVCSFAEHNGNYSVAFKNVLDWSSRINVKVFQNKPMLLMSTSPGKGGGANVMNIAKASFPRFGANIIETFSLPSFNENFSEETGIKNSELQNTFLGKITSWLQELEKLKSINS